VFVVRIWSFLHFVHNFSQCDTEWHDASLPQLIKAIAMSELVTNPVINLIWMARHFRRLCSSVVSIEDHV
jgi:hypothetical protein